MLTKLITARKALHLLLLCELIVFKDFIVCGEWSIQGIPKTGSKKKDKTNAHFDEKSKTLFVPKIDADFFVGDSLNFQGANLANVHLVNATIDGYIPHLAIDTLEIKATSASIGDGVRMATFDPRGGLSTANGVKWDERKETLQLQSLSSFSSGGINIHSDVDMNLNSLRNFKLDENTTFKHLRIESSVIVDTRLINATLDDLTLGSIKVNSLSIPSLQDSGSFLTVSADGNIGSSSSLQDLEESLVVKKKVEFTDSVNFKGSMLENVDIRSGALNGDQFDLNVRNIDTHSLTLKTFRDSKSHVKDAIVVIKDDGSLTSSNILIDNGWIGNMKIFGNVDFKGKYVDSEHTRVPGKILGAVIEGGRVKELEELSVSGPTSINDNLDVKGDAFIDGSLTVGGSVLGSGPYVDVSDIRLKTNVKRISCAGMLEKLIRLQAVHYELNHDKFTDLRTEKNLQEIGFLAQEVMEIFPDLVTIRSDGFLGLQYSRFTPLIVEGMKDTHIQLEELRRENLSMKAVIEELVNRVEVLETRNRITV